MEEVKDIKITSKYGDYNFGVTGNISIPSSYNDKLVAKKMTSLKINESKYCSFRIDELINSVKETDGYEDKFTILKTGNEFKEMVVNGKYLDISLNLPKTTDYRFRAKIQYPKLDIDESMFKTRTKILENSQLEYDAVKGTVKEEMPLIDVNGYEISLKIIAF
jgi:hypothetical protein